MQEERFDKSGGLSVLERVRRQGAATSARGDVCAEAVALAREALGAARAGLFLREGDTATVRLAATAGEALGPQAAAAGEAAASSGAPIEEGSLAGGTPSRISIPLPGPGAPIGALVLESPSVWTPAARLFARALAGALSARLEGEALLESARRRERELARLERGMEILHELAGSLQDLKSEEAILHASLDLLLDRLDLPAGWIFLFDPRTRRLELSASRGVSDAFVTRARESGVDDCLCLDVFSTGRPRVACNTLDCPRLPGLVRGPGAPAHACVPLKFERGVLGVMNIACGGQPAFTQPQLAFLATAGRQICLAVDRARTARDQSRSNREARTLAALARAVGGSLEQERVLGAVAECARDLLAADRCAILLGHGEGPLLFAHLSGPPMKELVVGSPVDPSLMGPRAVAAIQQRRAVMVSNGTAEGPADRSRPHRPDAGSSLFVPLVSHDRLEGLLVADRRKPSAWSAEELDLADGLAGQAAVAIQNARFYGESREALLRLQQAQHGMMLAERMAAVGTLASCLAHEVRNPLNSIALQLVLLGRRMARLEEPVRSELSALIETARREISRLDGLVEEFLSLSSIDRIKLAEASPCDVVWEVIELMAPVARARGISLTGDARGPRRALIDQEKIRQALINLVRNAIEATPGGGSITVTCRDQGGAVVISVADTGTGIEPGLDVFDFFVTTKHGGTGLGLPIARRIAQAHGGTLTFVSEPGRGAVFTLMLAPEGILGATRRSP